MDHGKDTRQILSFNLGTEQGREQARLNLQRLAWLAEAGLIEGMAVRSVQANGQVRYQGFGSLTAEDWASFVLHCVSGR